MRIFDIVSESNVTLIDVRAGVEPVEGAFQLIGDLRQASG
jgi:hypothetical protein